MLSHCSALEEEAPSLEAEEVGIGIRWDLDALGSCRVRQSILTGCSQHGLGELAPD